MKCLIKLLFGLEITRHNNTRSNAGITTVATTEYSEICLRLSTVIGIAVGVAFVLISAFCGICCLLKKNKKEKKKQQSITINDTKNLLIDEKEEQENEELATNHS